MSVGEGSVDADNARETQIAEQCSVLEKTIDGLRASVDVLEPRLEQVVRSSSDPDASKDTVAKTLCPLANWLRSRSDEIEILAHRISALTNRIEL